jgi:hypothetical protein
VGDAKAGFERRLEAHLEFSQGDRFNPHGAPKKINKPAVTNVAERYRSY